MSGPDAEVGNRSMGGKVSHMKYFSTVATGIVAVAVLLAAYAVGLLIRQARIRSLQPEGQAVAAPNDTAAAKAALESHGPGPEKVQRDETKEEEADVPETMNDLAEEGKGPSGPRGRDRLGGEGSRGRFANLPPEQREKMLRKWQDMSEEERQAYRAKMKASSRTRREARQEVASDASEGESTTTEQNGEESGSEPNEADQG